MGARIKKCKHCMSDTLYISWSALRTHRECRQRGKLMRAGKRATLDNVRGYFPGTVTDRVVRDWLADDPENNPGLMPDMVESILLREEEYVREGNGKLVWKNRDDKDMVLKDCIEAVTKIEPSLEKYVLPFKYSVDHRFKVPMRVPHPSGVSQLVMINGAMDILVQDADERFAVWDVKHTRDEYYWKKTRGQLSFYDLAVQLEFGKKTVMTGLLQPLCKKPVLPFRITDDERNVLLQDVLRMTQDIFKGDFQPTDDLNQCTYCAVKHACPRWAPKNDGTQNRFSLL